MADLDEALQQFEATESNLEKLDKLWAQIATHIGSGPAFGSPPEYGELCLAFRQILPALPAIDGFRVEDKLHDYDAIGQMRLDALEVGEIEAKVSVENFIEEQGRLLREYRFKLQAKRRELDPIICAAISFSLFWGSVGTIGITEAWSKEEAQSVCSGVCF